MWLAAITKSDHKAAAAAPSPLKTKAAEFPPPLSFSVSSFSVSSPR
jgi:hypothetical protein